MRYSKKWLRVMGKNYLEQIRGRLAAENTRDDSDPTLARVLGPCVCGHWLVPVAKQLRNDGVNLI
jgi:hypothetical protein